MNSSRNHITQLFICLCLFVGVGMVVFADQAKFIEICLGFTIAFVSYLFLVSRIEQLWIKQVLLMAALAKISLIFIFPSLSDDIYRFFWDGRLIHEGFNPYSYTPEQWLRVSNMNGYKAIFDQLNSQSYYSIYPPVSQLLFYISSYTNDISVFSILLKSLFVLIDFLNLYLIIHLLTKFKKPVYYSAIYFLNPLVIVEGLGNLHFEMVLITFLLLFLIGLAHSSIKWSSIAFGLSIATKITPLLVGPLILFYHRSRRTNWVFIIFGFLTVLASFIPILYGVNSMNVIDSIDLYFRKFEFNASIYYVLRELGMLISGYNLIRYLGPILAVITIIGIIHQASRVRKGDLISLIKAILLSYTIYLFLATTVHPWYLLPMVALCSFVRLNFILLWSFLITLSYYTYSTLDWTESVYVLIIEYGIVFTAFYYEVIKDNNKVLITE